MYEYMYKQYGYRKKTAEQKILQYFQTALCYRNLPKIRIFLSLLNLIKNNDQFLMYDQVEIQMYINFLIAMDDADQSKNKLKGLHLSQDQKQESYISLNKGLDFISSKFCS